ncbi:MerR family transcriptional regulator [Halanaerobium congolense]|uniref:MerR family transcriptional regulator n=1 Tax=Halanaerobium congolense TaxID=54121 RepID=UPI0014151359
MIRVILFKFFLNQAFYCYYINLFPNVETVLYYERKKLIPEPPRNSSRYRQYSSKELKRLKFIKSAQKLGLSLKEISEITTFKSINQLNLLFNE